LKILLKRRFLLISLIVTILALVIASAVWAATVFTIPAQVNVVAPTYDIAVFSDPACTIPLTNLVWAADLPQGGERDRTVYIKNVGNMDALVTATLQSPPSGVTLENDTITVSMGTSSSFDVVLVASADAQLGAAQKFTITFTSTAPPTTTTTTTTQ
jgi:hypothetical protein